MAYGGYRGRTIGRLMHFLYQFSPRFDEMAKIGDGKVYWGYSKGGGDGPVCATFEWIGDTDYPQFTFCGNHKHFNEFQPMIHERVRKMEILRKWEPWSEAEEIERKRIEDNDRRKRLYDAIMKG